MNRIVDKINSKFAQIRQTQYFPFLALFILSGTIFIFALRHNNATMVRLREELYAVDRAGGDVDKALNDLRTYVYGHMNTNLSSGNGIKPPIQLAYTYQRLEEQQQKQLQAQNSTLYTDAENYCQRTQPEGFFGRTRIPCVTEYINSRGLKIDPIPEGLYKFDFVSPTWSPDLAGWSLIVTILSGLALAASFLISKLARIKKLFI